MEIKELKIGTIFKCSWNGMADYFELVDVLPKSVKLRKLEWESCSAPEGFEEADPVHRWTRLRRDENGNYVYAQPCKYYTKRLTTINGYCNFKSPNYNGNASVRPLKEGEKDGYMLMYWG